MLVKGDVSGPTSRCSCARTSSTCPATSSATRRATPGALLHRAMERIAAEGRGVILYLRRSGRGLDLFDVPRGRQHDRRRAPASRRRAPASSATSASARRSCATSACARSAGSRTTRSGSSACPATVSRSSSGCRSRSRTDAGQRAPAAPAARRSVEGDPAPLSCRVEARHDPPAATGLARGRSRCRRSRAPTATRCARASRRTPARRSPR